MKTARTKRRAFGAVGTASAASAALIGALALAGCSTTPDNDNGGDGGSDEKPETLKVWRLGEDTDDNVDFMTKVNEEFEEDTGIEVDVSWIAWPAVGDKFQAAAAGGSGPDVTEIGNTEVASWANQGALADITEYVDDWSNAEDIPDNLWDYEKFDDSTYAVPWLGGSRVVYYRSDWFDELDIDEPTSWQELEDAAKTITEEKGDDVAGFAINGGADAIHTIAPFIWGNGGEIVTEEGDEWVAQVEEPEVIEAIDFYSGLVTDAEVSPRAYSAKDSVEIQGDFIHDQVGMYLEGAWGEDEILDEKDGDPDLEDKIDTFPLPGKDGGVAPQAAGGNDLAVWEDSEHQKWAFEYIEHLTTKENVKEYAPIAGLLPEYSDVLEEYTEDPDKAAYAEAFEEGRGYPTSENWVEVDENKTVMQTAIQEIVDGDKDTEEAMSDAADEINELMNQ